MPPVRSALAIPGLIGAILVVRRHLVPTLLSELDASDAIVVDVETEGDGAVQMILDALAIEGQNV